MLLAQGGLFLYTYIQGRTRTQRFSRLPLKAVSLFLPPISSIAFATWTLATSTAVRRCPTGRPAFPAIMATRDSPNVLFMLFFIIVVMFVGTLSVFPFNSFCNAVLG